MNLTHIFSFIILFGGLLGYFRRASLTSLLISLVFFFILFLAAQFQQILQKRRQGIILSFASSLVLALVMGYRFSISGKFMPAVSFPEEAWPGKGKSFTRWGKT